MTDKIVILTTCESQGEAEQIAHKLLETHLAACVTILPPARSIYHWKGGIESAEEIVLWIKSRRDLFDSARAEIEKLHSYEVPEIIALPVVAGAAPYLEWVGHNLREAALDGNRE